jgi:pimeloyl-ACP methyl ester carboxylesterase
MPVVVFMHGFGCDKSFFRGLAFEFVKRGFACVLITSRGSHGSGGVWGLTYENEILTVVDHLEMMANSGFPIDMARIGLIGHSMGAFSVTFAAKFDDRINSTVAIAGPSAHMFQSSILDILESGAPSNIFLLPIVFSSMNSYFQVPGGYLWELLSKNAEIAGNTSKDGVIFELNSTNPSNYLNMVGTIDEGVSVYSAQELLWYMGLKDPPNNISNYWQIKRYHLYGDFNGTARKLVPIPMMEHISVLNHPITIYESINWMERSMKLSHPIYGSIEHSIYQVLFRDSFGEVLFTSATYINLIGLFIILLPISIYLGNWLKSKFSEAKIAKEIENKKIWLMFLIYGVAFCLISLITWPVIKVLNIVPFTDFLGSNVIFTFLVVQSILFLPVLIGLILYEHRRFDEKWEDFGIHPRAFPKSAIFGILLSIFAFAILNIVITPSYFNIFIEKPESFLESFLYMLFVMSITEILFRGLIQTKLSRYNNVKLKFVSKYVPAWKELLLSSLITGIIQGIGFGIIGSLFLGNFPFNALISPLTIFGICFGIFFLISLINNWLYRKQRNVLGIIIFNAFIFTWISTLFPAISGSII